MRVSFINYLAHPRTFGSSSLLDPILVLWEVYVRPFYKLPSMLPSTLCAKSSLSQVSRFWTEDASSLSAASGWFGDMDQVLRDPYGFKDMAGFAADYKAGSTVQPKPVTAVVAKQVWSSCDNIYRRRRRHLSCSNDILSASILDAMLVTFSFP